MSYERGVSRTWTVHLKKRTVPSRRNIKYHTTLYALPDGIEGDNLPPSRPNFRESFRLWRIICGASLQSTSPQYEETRARYMSLSPRQNDYSFDVPKYRNVNRGYRVRRRLCPVFQGSAIEVAAMCFSSSLGREQMLGNTIQLRGADDKEETKCTRKPQQSRRIYPKSLWLLSLSPGHANHRDPLPVSL